MENESKKAPMNSTRIAMRVSVDTIIVNCILSALKLFAGVIGRSSAMISDAVHSLSDVLSTIIVMIGIKMAGKESDEGHPYGHERMESVAALLLAIMLAATGFFIGYDGILKIINGKNEALAIPTGIALIAAILSIVVKEAMYWYTRGVAKRINSGALMADAWHHRSDAFSSIGSFIGILGARLGLAILDPIASVVICLFILKAAYDIFMDAIRKMTDASCDKQTLLRLEEAVLTLEGVCGIDSLKTRLFGNRIYVDVEICANANVSLAQGHIIAQRVHDVLESDFPEIKHCMVHVNPIQETLESE